MSATKRETTEVTVSANNIILDIEGTTTSISFVKDVLFPYVRKHVNEFVKHNLKSDNIKTIVDALKSQAKEDEENKLEGVIAIPETAETDVLAKALVDNVLWQMDTDRKTKVLKDLQGLIYEEGYKKGDLKGHVYEDVEPCLKAWTEEGKSVYIYSSGSVQAQKLLYGHSEKGDLLTYIKGHFDTTVGMKGESQSYKKILEEISCTASEAVFLTDVPKEAQAAKEAGILALLVSRDGNAALAEEDKSDFQVITSFDEIKFEQNSKKRKLSSDKDLIAETDNKQVESCSQPVSEIPKVPKASNEEEKMDVDEDSVQTATGVQNTEESKSSEVAPSEGEEVVEVAKSEVASSESEKEVGEVAKSEVATSESEKEVVEAAKSKVASSESEKEVGEAAKSEVASSESEKEVGEVAKSEVMTSESEKEVGEAKSEVASSESEKEVGEEAKSEVATSEREKEAVEVAKSEVVTSKSEKEVVEAAKSDEAVISSSDDSKQVKEKTNDVCKPKQNDHTTDSADSQVEKADTEKVESTADSVEKEANKETSKPDSTDGNKATAVTDSITDPGKVADSTEQIEIPDKTESEPTEKKTEPEKSSPLEVVKEVKVKESSKETEKAPAEVSKVARDEKVEVPKEDAAKGESKVDSNEETKVCVEKDDNKPSEEDKEESKIDKKEDKKEVVAVNGEAKTNGASHDDKTPNGDLTNGKASFSDKTKANGTHDEAVENGREESVKAGKLASSDTITVEPVIES